MTAATYHLIETAVVSAGIVLALASAARMAWQRLQPKGARASRSTSCAPACGGGACAGCGPSNSRSGPAPVHWHSAKGGPQPR